MAINEREHNQAQKRAQKQRAAGYAVSARYDRRSARVVVKLSTDVEIRFPARLAEGLTKASADDLVNIEISPSGLGLRWPTLDADLYVPGLISGQLGSKQWMAAQLGVTGGKARSTAKTASSRNNGRKGGRPRKDAASTASA